MVYKIAVCGYILWQLCLEDIDRHLFQLSVFSLFGLEPGLLPWAVPFWTIEGSYDQVSPILSPEDVIGGRRPTMSDLSAGAIASEMVVAGKASWCSREVYGTSLASVSALGGLSMKV